MRLFALTQRRWNGGGVSRRRSLVAVESSQFRRIGCWMLRGAVLLLLVAVLTIQQRLLLLHHYAVSSSVSVSPLPLPLPLPSPPSSRNLDGVVVVGRSSDRTHQDENATTTAATSTSTRPPAAATLSAGADANERRMDRPIVTVHDGEMEEDDGDGEGDAGWLTMLDVDVYLDGFSDSWCMSIDTFVDTKEERLQEIEAVEQACFNLFEDREDQVRMPVDWLQWSVEHMSTWWKVLDVPSDPYTHSRVLRYLDNYADDPRVGRPPPVSELHPTLALVAFQQYSDKARTTGIPSVDQEARRRRYRQLTASSLSATLASLMRAGMGRIVVVGWNASETEERPLVDEAFRRVASVNVTANPTQLAYVTVPTDLVRTNFIPVNVPRGALLGLRRALLGNDPEWTNKWLGTPSEQNSPWAFVYLTEPDTILHSRPSAFRDMEQMLRRGRILVPHRLQPIPYQGDVPESDRRHTFISPEQVVRSTKIVELDAASSHVACCDEQRGITHRPGPQAAAQAGLGTRCGWDKWWQCGFLANSSHHGNHSLILHHYQLIRLTQGTGVTLVAGSSHGRRCVPTVLLPTLPTDNGTTTVLCPRRNTRPNDDPKLHARPKNPWITPQRLQERRARVRRDQLTSSNQTVSTVAR